MFGLEALAAYGDLEESIKEHETLVNLALARRPSGHRVIHEAPHWPYAEGIGLPTTGIDNTVAKWFCPRS